MRIAAPRTALFALLAVFTCPSLSCQSFTFSAPKTIPLPSALASKQIETLDLSGDGKTDLGVSLHTGFYVIAGDGKGNFPFKPVPAQWNDVHVQLPSWYDVNGDGKADAAAAYGNNPQGGYASAFEVWLGDGKGDLKKTFSSPLLDGLLTSMAAGDFNNDGRVDFAMTINDTFNFRDPCELIVFLNAGGGNFRVGQYRPIQRSFPRQMAAGDFNGDGGQDLAWFDDPPYVGSENSFYVHYYFGDGKGTFQTNSAYTFNGLRPSTLAAADLNHDGKTDLIVGLRAKIDANGHTIPGALPSIAILLAGPGEVFHQSASISLPGVPVNLALVDMNGDGLKDLVVNTSGTNAATYILAGESGGKFGAPHLVSGPAGLAVVAPAVKGGLPDIFYPNQAGTAIELLVNTSRK